MAAVDPSTVGLALLIFGIVLIIAEAATPGFFIGVIGTAFIAMGIIGMVFPFLFDSPISVVIVVVVTACSMLFAIMFYQKLGRTQPTATTITESNVGKEGIVLEEIEPHSLHGKVKINQQIWSATADVEIPKGCKVKVIDWDGVHVIVEEVKEEEIAAKKIKGEVEV
ncbi:MAG: NfeD family protein [Thermoplasmata archaeon]|nr:MAG: NfeD family protein [Thermoplasmata archaeon]